MGVGWGWGEERQVRLAALTTAMRAQLNMYRHVLKSEIILFSEGEEMVGSDKSRQPRMLRLWCLDSWVHLYE